jgi:hypothetical protein
LLQNEEEGVTNNGRCPYCLLLSLFSVTIFIPNSLDVLIHFRIEPVAEAIGFNIQIVIHLKSKPELRRHPEILGKPESRIGSNAALPKDDLVDAPRGNPNVRGKLGLAQAHWLQEILEENLTGMDWFKFLMPHNSLTSMVINDLHIIRISAFPTKAYSVPIVNPDTVLAFTVTLQSFKPIGRGNLQILQRNRPIQHPELSQRDSMDVRGKSLRANPVEKFLGVPGLEGTDHMINI